MYGLEPSDIAEILTFVFSNTVTRIEDQLYRQIQGVAMGSHCGAAYAILLLNHYEQIALSRFPDKFLRVFRYIDDYFIIADSPETRDALFATMNSLHPRLKFTLETPNSNGSLIFLDMSVSLNNGAFQFDHYQKETHSGRYLHWKSAHPPRTKINIIRTETSRIIENCGRSMSKAAHHLEKLQHQLRASDYPNHIIQKHMEAIRRSYQSNGRHSQHSGSNNSRRRSFQRMENPRRTDNDTNIDKNLLRVPFVDPILSRLINKEVRRNHIPIWLVEYVSPTLQNRLITYNKKSNYGSCRGCRLCVELSHNCATRFVVYQLTCELCHGVYIGKTYRPINVRLKEHNSSVRLGNMRTAAGEHVLQHHPEIGGTG